MSVSLCWKSRTMVFALRTFVILLAFSSGIYVFAKKEGAPPAPKISESAKSSPTKHSEPVIEDVTAKQLEKVLNERDYVAVFWCKYDVLLLSAISSSNLKNFLNLRTSFEVPSDPAV